MVMLDPAHRKTFDRLDSDIAAAKITLNHTAVPYTDIRTDFIQGRLEHEQSARNPRKVDTEVRSHEVEATYAEYVNTDCQLTRDRRWLEALINWRHYIVELIGTLGQLRKLYLRLWDVVEAYKRADQDEDDYLAQDALDVLSYDLLKNETRLK